MKAIKRSFLLSRYFLLVLFICNALLFLTPPTTAQQVHEDSIRALVDDVSFNNIKDHFTYLSSLSRLTGSKGCDEAAEYIREVFAQYADEVYVQEFNVTVPIDNWSSLTVFAQDGALELQTWAMWPNYVNPSPTPPEGVSGPLVYVGDGEFQALNGLSLNGSIILMDFNSRDNWIRMFSLGAKAVIFIEPSETTRYEAESKYLSDLPLYAPRAYIKREDAEVLLSMISKESVIANLKLNIAYDVRIGKNVVALFRGKDLRVSNEVVIIHSYYDAMSVVPSLSFGAEETGGISVLLELARFLKVHPPGRTVVLAAFSAHEQALLGARNFVDSLHKGSLPFRPWIGNQTENTGIRHIIGFDLYTESNLVAVLLTGDYMLRPATEVGVDTLKNWYIDYLYQDEKNSLRSRLEAANRSINFIVWTEVENWQLLRFVQYASDSEVFQQAVLGYALTYRTAYKWMLKYHTPLDTIDRVQIDNLKTQATFSIISVYEMTNFPCENPLFYAYPMGAGILTGGRGWPNYFLNFYGMATRYDPTRADIGFLLGLPNAIIGVRCLTGGAIPGVTGTPLWLHGHDLIVKADEEGYFRIPGLRGHAAYLFETFVMNSTGAVIYAPDQGPLSNPNLVYLPPYGEYPAGGRRYSYKFVAFKSASIVFFDLSTYSLKGNPFKVMLSLPSPGAGVAEITPAYVPGMALARVYDARTQALTTQRGLSVSSSGVLMLYFPPETPVYLKISLVEGTPIGLYLRDSGLTLNEGESLKVPFSAFVMYKNFRSLNDERVSEIFKYGLVVPDVVLYREYAKEAFETAQSALADMRYSEAYGKAVEAWLFERSAYEALISGMRDSMNTLIAYFILLIPFAIIVSTAAFGELSATRRVLATIGIFAAGILPLYFFHAGFHILSSLPSLLIGLLVLVLVSPLLALLIGELSSTLQALRRRIVGEHFIEISRTGATQTSMVYGIRHMKRHSLTSFLTIFSLSCVVFSLTAFTSTQLITGVTGRPVTESTVQPQVVSHYAGILLRDPTDGFSAPLMNVQTITALRSLYWKYPSAIRTMMRAPAAQISGFRLASQKSYTYIKVIIGLEQNEFKLIPYENELAAGTPFYNDDLYVCMIDDTVAMRLGVDINDTVSIGDLRLKIIGIINNATANQNLVDLNQFSIAPRASLLAMAQWPLSTTLLIPSKLSFALGAEPYAFLVDFGNYSPGMEGEAKKLSLLFRDANIYWSNGEGIGENVTLKEYSSTFAVTMTGYEFVAAPVGIVFFSILNLMMANIHRRKEEIYTFSAVGLSPLHVTFIFLSEAILYGITGSLIGYISGLAFQSFLRWSNLLPEGINMNFSSSYVLLGLFVAMLSTLVSSIYPLWISSRMITPSVRRKWKIETLPEAGKWRISLPFMIPEEEVGGLMVFLLEYISQFQVEESTAPFVARNILLRSEKIENRVAKIISAEAHIRPFDRGIHQRTSIIVSYTGKKRYSTEIDVELIIGSEHEWRKYCRGFIDTLRKQFLIWRTLPIESREKYIIQAKRTGER